jgi:general stress protein 26
MEFCRPVTAPNARREQSRAAAVCVSNRNSKETTMSTEPTSLESADRIWTAAEKIHTAMLVTRSGEMLISRPMAPIVRRGEASIWFLTDKDSGKLGDIVAHPQVSVSFSEGSDHLAFHGAATVHDDRAIIKDLWSNAAQAYYPNGPDDPLVLALRVLPDHAEYWDGPGSVVAMFKIAAAVASGKSVRDMGEHVEAEL